MQLNGKIKCGFNSALLIFGVRNFHSQDGQKMSTSPNSSGLIFQF